MSQKEPGRDIAEMIRELDCPHAPPRLGQDAIWLMEDGDFEVAVLRAKEAAHAAFRLVPDLRGGARG